MSKSRFLKRSTAVGMGLVLFMALKPEWAAAADGSNDLHWEPAKTRVFIACLYRYKGDKKATWDTSERMDGKMAKFFQERGVPKQHIIHLMDDEASLANVKKHFTQLMQESKPGELLVFYFGGHGSYGDHHKPGSLCLFDQQFDPNWLFDEMEKDFKGSRALLFADCCFSGGIVELAKKRKTAAIGYACLSSTYSTQEATSGSRFQLCLMRGFEGDPRVDLNGDGHVDFEELATYTERYMAFAAEGKPMFTTTKGFNPKLHLAPTEGRKREHVGSLVEVKSSNQWWKAEIIGVTPKGFKIHYTDDTKSTNDKEVAEAEVRKHQYTHFKVGEEVSVKCMIDDKWYPAKVLGTFESLCHCRLEGNNPPATDQWFGPSRIRKER
jgi:hypothetical protein